MLTSLFTYTNGLICSEPNVPQSKATERKMLFLPSESGWSSECREVIFCYLFICQHGLKHSAWTAGLLSLSDAISYPIRIQWQSTKWEATFPLYGSFSFDSGFTKPWAAGWDSKYTVQIRSKPVRSTLCKIFRPIQTVICIKNTHLLFDDFTSLTRCMSKSMLITRAAREGIQLA